MRELTLPVNGVSLRVLQAGPADRPAVLLLHGFPDLAHGWWRQIDALAAAGYRVIAPNQRGYPGSSKPRRVEPYRVPHLVRDALALLDALDVPAAHVVGHDWGGVIAWWLAAEHPDRVRSLTVMNMPHPRVFARAVRTSAQLLRSTYALVFQIPGVEHVLTAAHALPVAALLRVARTGRWSRQEIQRYRTAFGERRAMTSMLAWYRAQVRWGDLPREGQISVRTLILWGRRDVALSVRLVAPSAALCDHVTVRVFAHAGHFVQHDAAAAVNEALLAHLAVDPSAP